MNFLSLASTQVSVVTFSVRPFKGTRAKVARHLINQRCWPRYNLINWIIPGECALRLHSVGQPEEALVLLVAKARQTRAQPVSSGQIDDNNDSSRNLFHAQHQAQQGIASIERELIVSFRVWCLLWSGKSDKNSSGSSSSTVKWKIEKPEQSDLVRLASETEFVIT